MKKVNGSIIKSTNNQPINPELLTLLQQQESTLSKELIDNNEELTKLIYQLYDQNKEGDWDYYYDPNRI